MKDCQKIYQQLERSEKSPTDFTTAFLFEMASQFAVKGDFTAKNKIYEEFILKHSDANSDDKARVFIYRADLQRRNGDPKGALETLQAIQSPIGNMARAEWLQSAGQCYLILGDLQQAFGVQRQILKLFVGSSIPPDKQLYYLETLMAMKLRANETDEELDEFFRIYEQLLENPSLSGAIKERAQAALEILRGRAESRKGNLAAATNHYWACFELAPAVRNKTVAVLQFLYCRWQIDPNDDSPFVQNAMEFFKSHWETIQQADIIELRNEFVFVTQKLRMT